jgi:hypothetical protein
MGVIGEFCEDNKVGVILNYLTIVDNVEWKPTHNRSSKLKNVNFEQNEVFIKIENFAVEWENFVLEIG